MENKTTRLSSKQLLAIAGLIIFVTEFLVMYWIESYPHLGIQIPTLVDATLTSLIVSSLLYYFSFRPLNQQMAERIQAVDDYKVQKAYLEELIENAPEAIVIVDNEDRVMRINGEFTRMFGYEDQEAIGRDINSLIVPEELSGNARGISQNVAAGNRASLESVRRHKNGSPVYVSILGTPVHVEGSQIGVYGIYRDITEQMKAKEALQQSEERFRAISQSANDAIVTVNSSGYIVGWNRGAERVFGYKETEIVGKSLVQIIPNEFQADKRSGSRLRDIGGVEYVMGKTTEVRGLRNDNKMFPIEFSLSEWKTSEGQFFTGIMRDISDRKSAEDKIRQLSAAIEQSPVSVVITDTQGRIEYVNPWFTEITGFSALEAIGQKPSILKSGHTSVSEYKKLWETITAGGRWRGEFQNKKKNGETYWEIASISAIKGSDGRIRNYVAVKDDITEQKIAQKALIAAREEAESAMRAKSDFLATMSHEIRTPMNGVIGMTELLLDTDLTPEQRDFVETIQVSGDSLLTVLNDILDYSKIESGKMEFEKRAFDLTECLETTLDIFSSKAAEKKIELIYSIDSAVPSALIGDESRIKQILMNLTNNSLKFTETGEVYISVQMSNGDDSAVCKDDAELIFKVKDTGIGIPTEKIDRLFKSFSQVDSSTTRKYGGTGLGLAISEKLVTMMGGRIWVDSVEGVGSTFSFTIKVGVDQENRLKEETIPSEFKDKRVLIVDDNETNRQILLAQCVRMGMAPIATESPLEALNWIGHGQLFDLGIIDMHMPEMDGLELGLAIREMRNIETLPLLMLSSLGNRAKPENYPANVFSAFISKPVKLNQLKETVKHVFAGSKKEKQIFESTLDAQLSERLPLKILLAEDNAINQKLAVLAFQKMGYQVDVADNGLKVLAALRQKTYDLIFMDVQMPEMDGLEATRQIVKAYSQEDRPRIIAMTANAMKEDRDQCINAGMNDFITKPINIKQIQSKLIEWGGNMAPEKPKTTAVKPIVDLDQLRDIGVTADFFKELADMYIDQAETLLGEIKDYAHVGELSGFRKIAHTLKGISANIGAVAMVEACQSLEKIQAHHRPKEIAVLIHRIGIVYEETCFHLKQLMLENHFFEPVEAA
ncbi:PAS domain S-box protein [bacterium]|nr:MAG: PAS domain S-box protein [bacterium]